MKTIALLLILLSLSARSNVRNESELGLTEARGNTQNMTFFGKHASELNKGKSLYIARGHYYYGKANDELNLRNWMSEFRWKRTFAKRWDSVLSQKVEGNRFMGYEWRTNTDIGTAFYLIPKKEANDRNFLLLEFGYRYQYEERVVADDVDNGSHQSRIFIQNSREHSKTFFTMLSTEWAKTHGNDHRDMLTIEASANANINSTFTMKTSYTIRYDDTLQARGFEYSNDRILTISLVANY